MRSFYEEVLDEGDSRQFAGVGHRPLVGTDLDEPLGDLVAGQPTAAGVLEPGFVERPGPGDELDERDDGLPLGTGNPPRRPPLHLGDLCPEERLHLSGRDVLASGLDHAGEAAEVVQPPVLLEPADITGVEIVLCIGGTFVGSSSLDVVIAAEEVPALEADLALLADIDRPPAASQIRTLRPGSGVPCAKVPSSGVARVIMLPPSLMAYIVITPIPWLRRLS